MTLLPVSPSVSLRRHQALGNLRLSAKSGRLHALALGETSTVCTYRSVIDSLGVHFQKHASLAWLCLGGAGEFCLLGDVRLGQAWQQHVTCRVLS